MEGQKVTWEGQKTTNLDHKHSGQVQPLLEHPISSQNHNQKVTLETYA